METWNCDESYQELQEKFKLEFEHYKMKFNCSEYPNVNSLLYNLNLESDVLLYKLQYQTDRFVKDYLAIKENMFQTDEARFLETQKAEYITKMQTLLSMITCSIVNDYKKKMEEKLNK